ncbi:MAG: hypothetical protein KGZ25_13025 [Planctomycetes bacterium]|nr:hypothetical protein [Planctomycetota bacterium]
MSNIILQNKNRSAAFHWCVRVIAILAIVATPVLSIQGADELTVDAEELEQFPLKKELPGNPPADGLRYWREPFKPIGIHASYVTVVIRKGTYELWYNTWGKDLDDRQIVVNRGRDLQHLGETQPVFDSSIIDDVPDPKNPDTLSPERGITRPWMYYDEEVGYVLACCVCPGYYPGSVPLLPALIRSRSGKPGTWTYRGKLKGDPVVIAKKRKVWSDGGSLHQLDDGSWRLYINGFGPAIGALEAKSLKGPWKFRRGPDGKIRDLLPDDPDGPQKGGPWINVVRAGPEEWHLWFTDGWPPQCIWHLWSKDGLKWELYGKQPEITRFAVGGHGIKCLRAYLDADGKHIVGLLSVWSNPGRGDTGWILHESTMPVGRPSGQ